MLYTNMFPSLVTYIYTAYCQCIELFNHIIGYFTCPQDHTLLRSLLYGVTLRIIILSDKIPFGSLIVPLLHILVTIYAPIQAI
jgi:hypothetical protein